MSGGYGVPFFFQPPSDEELQQMKEAQQRAEMSQQEFLHGFQRLFDELDEGQLKTLRQMLLIAPDFIESVHQWAGMIAMVLKMKHNICITCNRNHDEELLAPTKDNIIPYPEDNQPVLPIFDEEE